MSCREEQYERDRTSEKREAKNDIQKALEEFKAKEQAYMKSEFDKSEKAQAIKRAEVDQRRLEAEMKAKD